MPIEYCPQCGNKIDSHSHTCPSCGLTIPQGDLTQLSDETLPGEAASRPEDAALAAGRVLGGRYEIIDVIGRGGMGWVYRARDREIDRVLALKVIRQDLGKDESVIKRFRDEIILARRVTHKNVLRIYDIAEADGIKFISMPYIEGKDLKTAISERGPFSVDETIQLARQVGEALKSAHDAGVIHRDLKPQNIMIDREGTAYVTDFGIAKSAEAGGLTVTGQIVGTPEYMSPEQAEGKEVDRRTDIYSFGLVIYEMLTGEVPFKADSIIATLMKRLRETPEPPSKKNQTTPLWLDNLVMKALEREVANRYASVDEILADIDRQAVKPRRRLGKRMLAVAVAAAAATACAVLVAVLRPTLVFEKSKIYMAVLPFENATDDKELDWLARGIPDNLTADLAQSRFFRVMSPERLRQVLGEIGQDEASVAAPEAMRRLAEATGLTAVVLGSFVKAGDVVRITMKVEDAGDQEIIGTRIVEGSAENVLDMIDELTRNTKSIFRLSQRDIDSDMDREVAQQRTKSVKAASQFGRGLDLAYKGAHLEAARAFENAIESDPDFAMAYAKAAEAYKNLGYDEKAERLSLTAVDKVVKFMDRVPPADRTFIMAGHANITHNSDQAIASYKDYIAAYPDDAEGYYKLGLTLAGISDWATAAANLRLAIEIDPKFGSARFELGKVLIQQDDLPAALEELERALGIYRDIGNREGEAGVLNAIGVAHRRKNDFEKAISYYEASMKIKEDLGDKRGTAASLGNIGLVYEIMGRRDEALEVLTRSLELKREIGDKMGTSTALNKMGQIQEADGRFEEALASYERSYEIRRELGSKDLMASSLSDMAIVYSLMGDYGKAMEADSLALALRQQIGDARDVAQSLRNIAESLLNGGLFREAEDRLRQAAIISKDLADSRLSAMDQQAFGSYYLFVGRADSALACLGRALETQQALNERPAVAATQSLMGEAHLVRREFTDALRRFDSACQIGTEVGEREVVASAILGKAKVFLELSYEPGVDSMLAQVAVLDEARLGHATRCYLRLLEAEKFSTTGGASDVPRACEEVVALVGRGDVRCRMKAGLVASEAELAGGMADRALACVDRTLEDAKDFGTRDIESEAMGVKAKCLLKQGKPKEALEACRGSLEVAGELGLAGFECLVTMGDIALEAGDKQEATGYYTRALDAADSMAKYRCPPRFRDHYLRRGDFSRIAATAADLLQSLGREAEARRLRTTFRLK